MSGRLFVPSALEGKNVYENAEVLRWEIKFVQCFVKHFLNHPAVIAWDLGNECENMQNVSSRNHAFVWLCLITNAIRAIDSTRPIVSGFANLSADHENGFWTMEDHTEQVDILTNHAYHIFESAIDPINSMRAILRPVAETLLYQGIGNKPCFLEEVGAIGYMNTSEKVESDYYRALLFSLWAHNCHGSLWWCAFDQGHLTQAPYDWNCIGSDYGYFRADGSNKPVAVESKKFMDFLSSFPFKTLSPRLCDGVCIIPNGLGTTAPVIATNTMALAVQCGIDLDFQSADQVLRDANLYLLPSIKGQRYITRRRFLALLEKIKEGAALYLSADDCFLRWFPELTGLTVASREYPQGETIVSINDKKIPIKAPFTYTVESVTSEVLATDQNSTPVYVCKEYGKGKIFFLNLPLEHYVSKKCGAFHEENAAPYSEFFKVFKRELKSEKIAKSNHPYLPITEHIQSGDTRIVIGINYSAKEQETTLALADGWRIDRVLYGTAERNRISVPRQDAVVLVVKKGEET